MKFDVGDIVYITYKGQVLTDVGTCTVLYLNLEETVAKLKFNDVLAAEGRTECNKSTRRLIKIEDYYKNLLQKRWEAFYDEHI